MEGVVTAVNMPFERTKTDSVWESVGVMPSKIDFMGSPREESEREERRGTCKVFVLAFNLSFHNIFSQIIIL